MGVRVDEDRLKQCLAWNKSSTTVVTDFYFYFYFLIVKNYSQNILVMVIDVCFIHTIIIEGTLVWKNLLV